jgi:hypothetical protein
MMGEAPQQATEHKHWNGKLLKSAGIHDTGDECCRPAVEPAPLPAVVGGNLLF